MAEATSGTTNPYRLPEQEAARPSGAELGGGAHCDLSYEAIRALGTTRIVLWLFILASGALLLYTIGQFFLAWRYMTRVEDSGSYWVIVLFSMFKGPLAAVFCWQFYSLERSLKRLVDDGRIEPLLTVQKNFWVTMALVIGAYLVVVIFGAGFLIARIIAANGA